MARILIAEDEPDIRELIAFTLSFAGHEVISGSNGEEAVQLARQNIPDLVILDVRMPRMTGYEACHQIKTDACLSHIPVIFLSAKGGRRRCKLVWMPVAWIILSSHSHPSAFSPSSNYLEKSKRNNSRDVRLLISLYNGGAKNYECNYFGWEIVHYEVLGRGRPLIFLHGWIGSWRYWIPSMQSAPSPAGLMLSISGVWR
jgi:CheY-like chemotaxis protein